MRLSPRSVQVKRRLLANVSLLARTVFAFVLLGGVPPERHVWVVLGGRHGLGQEVERLGEHMVDAGSYVWRVK